MKRRDFLAATLGAGALTSLAPLGRARAKSDTRPNIVVIVVDDLRYDEYGAGGHPYLETPNVDTLAVSGATFTQAYHVTPLCSPNRASILTGEYSSRHGIIDNTSRSWASHRLRTFAPILQRAGYETAHIGKWHMGNDPTPRPGYDHWISFAGQGSSRDPTLYEDGRLHKVAGYTTDLFTDRAIAFATRPRTKPFMLFLGHKAVHPDVQQLDDGTTDPATDLGFIPAERHRGRYAGKKFPRRRSVGFTQAVRENKPVIAAALDARNTPEMRNKFGATEAVTSDEEIQARAEMMLAVDEGLGRLVEALRSSGQLENTMIVFMSDNGSFFGEHGLGVERRMPYEESIRSPLIVSHPATIAPITTIPLFALSIDIAPTLIEIAGAPVPETVQGRSLVPLLRRDPPGDWRNAFLVEYHAHENPMPWTANLGYRALREGRYKYIHWTHDPGAAELYDLEADPLEEHNRAKSRSFRGKVSDLKSQLEAVVLQSLGLL
jgi:arylsulfatase A-like enzyme